MIKSWKQVNAEKYHKLMDIDGDLQSMFKIIFEQEISKIPISSINNGDFDWIKSTPDTVDIRFLTIDGTRFGLIDFDDLSMGEYIDLTMYTEDWKSNIWDIMAICYRPVTGITWRHKVKSFWGLCYMVAGILLKNQEVKNKASKMIVNMDYKIEKYDAKIHGKNAEKMKSISAEQYNSFLLFFSALSILKMGNTLKSLFEKISPKNPSPKKGKQNSR
jgi:hypothetical protein